MSKSHAAIFIIPVALALAGFQSREPLPEPLATTEEVEHPVLRVKDDLARGRRWELAWGTAYAYDIATEQLERAVRLEGASFSAVRSSCLPDMLLSRSGAVIVSSNAQPVIWRINPARFEVERFDLELDSDQNQDFGFSGLAWSANETALYAVNAVTGSLWRIDLATSRASKVQSPTALAKTCASPR